MLDNDYTITRETLSVLREETGKQPIKRENA
jgi:hypothetical protein